MTQDNIGQLRDEFGCLQQDTPIRKFCCECGGLNSKVKGEFRNFEIHAMNGTGQYTVSSSCMRRYGN